MSNNGSTNSMPNPKKLSSDQQGQSNNDTARLHKNEKDQTPVKATDRKSPQFSSYANGKPNAGGR